MNDTHDILLHHLATLAYRTQRTVQGAPPGFDTFEAGEGVRTPHELVDHMSQLLHFLAGLWSGGAGPALDPTPTFQEGVDRFYAQLARLASVVAETPGREPGMVLRALQGPLSDAMTHVGQLAMLRRLAGAPVARESYYKAPISSANLGPDQPPPAV